MPHAKLNLFSEVTVALAAFSKALAHPARIEILTFLRGRDSCVCSAIVDHIPLSQPSVSRHLSYLKDAGLIREIPRGNEIYYALESKHIDLFCRTFSRTLKP
jgi:DNA-binding transcriptional ArsR family regulator